MSHAMSRRILCIIVALAALPLVAPPAAARRTQAERAREHYKAGQAAYAAGRFQEAAKEFAAGYMLLHKPAFLINIAQSYRKAGRNEKALEYYEEYLRVAAPGSRLVPQVEGLVEELRRAVARERREAAAREERARKQRARRRPAPPAAVSVEQPPRARRRADGGSAPIYKRWWFWAGIGAVVAAGVGAGIYAGTREPDYVKEGKLGSVSW